MTTTIGTDRRDHARFAHSGDSAARYAAFTWDHDAQEWELRAKNIPLFALRDTIRDLESAGWSSVSYLLRRQSESDKTQSVRPLKPR